MKILSNKNQIEALKRIIANEIIIKNMVDIYNEKQLKLWTKAMENNSELAYIVGGIEGMCAVKEAVEKWGQ